MKRITIVALAVLHRTTPTALATRAPAAPTIDGKLDDACGKATKPTTLLLALLALAAVPLRVRQA